MTWPTRRLDAGAAQHHFPNGHDQPALLRNRDKPPRCHAAQAVVVPTEQTLELHQPAVACLHNRLVENLELIFLERRTEIGCNRAAGLHLLLHLRLEETPGVTPGSFRPVKRHVRIAEKMLGVGRLLILDRDAETDAG